MSTSPNIDKELLYDYLLHLGDNVMILGHRLSELCGHGPSLETDIALTNISLDLFGQTRTYYQYAAEIKGDGKTEDDLAFLRFVRDYKNTLLVEQKNEDFAHVIARSFFFDIYHLLVLEQLIHSKDEQVAAIAGKAIKEVRYHQRFSSQWLKRLGDGTDISHEKMQAAIDYLYPYIGELVEESPTEKAMKEAGIGANLEEVKEKFHQMVEVDLSIATMKIPASKWSHSGGKKGIHTEHMGFILSDLQFMQRAYPNMDW